MKSIFVCGYSGPLGGANVELWHTIRLWRKFGIGVELIPSWGSDPKEEAKLDALGCVTHHVQPNELASVPGLAGSVVVSFCNSEFLAHYDKFRKLGCRVIYASCMCFLFPIESRVFRDHGPADVMMYQSEFQRQKIESSEGMLGVEYNPQSAHLIRGAFDFDDWDFSPLSHTPGEQFVFGRAARPAEDKWSSNTWPIASRIQYPFKRALMLGVGQNIHRKLGRPPDWAECLPPLGIDTREFFRRLHCCFPVNGGAMENWPRIGLEAMAAGVPIVAQREWGWPEMIRDGETGLLGSCDEELAHQVARLAWDEGLRQFIISNARSVLVNELAAPDVIWAGWKRALEACGMDADAAIDSAAKQSKTFAAAAVNRVTSRHGKATERKRGNGKAQGKGKGPPKTRAKAKGVDKATQREDGGHPARTNQQYTKPIAIAGGQLRLARGRSVPAN